MKKGFTLLELIVVIIILGILATVGLGQYMRMVEKSRGAEARSILGAIRTEAAAIYMQNDNNCNVAAQLCNSANLGVSAVAGPGLYPGPLLANCQLSHYFFYSVTPIAPVAGVSAGVVIRADRCTAGGKLPVGAVGSIVLTANFATGIDGWANTAQY